MAREAELIKVLELSPCIVCTYKIMVILNSLAFFYVAYNFVFFSFILFFSNFFRVFLFSEILFILKIENPVEPVSRTS